MLEELSFHHVGVACKDIDKTARVYELLGYKKEVPVFDPLQNINICFLHHPTMPLIELLSPVDENSPVVQILSKKRHNPLSYLLFS